MKNFLRALKFAWPYRGRIIMSVLCALAAAAFWSLNFTAIYPVLKIIGSNQNLNQWIDSEIRQTQALIDPLDKKLDELAKKAQELEKRPPAHDVQRQLKKLTGEMAGLESQLESARSTQYRNHLLKTWIDRIFPNDCFQTLALVIGLVLVGVAFKGFFEFWQESLVGSVGGRAMFDLRTRFFRNSLRLDVGHFNEAGTTDLLSRFTHDVETLSNGMKTVFGRIVAEPLKALGCIVVACWISWKLTLMFVVLVPVGLLVLTKVGRTIKKATRKVLERMSSMYKLAQENFRSIRVVKAFTMEPYERRRLRAVAKDYYRRTQWVVVLDALAGPIIELIGVIGIAGALLVGAYLVLEKQTHLFGIQILDHPMGPETLLQLYVLLAAVADPVRKLSNVYTKLQASCAAADRVFHYFDLQPKVLANPNGPTLPRHAKSIEFRDVCFSYDPSRPILTGINLTVAHGEVVALVGKNGCGKSTLMGLLPRFFDPDHGAVLIDGADLRTADLRGLRQQVSIVTQDTILFDDTIYNNIAYGRRRAKREAIEEAARQAEVHEFIERLPKGYDTKVGEAAGKLSGGEKQRIGLARAILRDPAILVLDEFTSQADTKSEQSIHTMLRDYCKGRTTFIITHRLHTLEIADRIVVLEKGRIEAVGSHAELLASCRAYQALHDAQFQRRVA